MSRIVFWFRYVLNCCRNRGRSSSVSRWCSSRYPSADSTAASSSVGFHRVLAAELAHQGDDPVAEGSAARCPAVDDRADLRVGRHLRPVAGGGTCPALSARTARAGRRSRRNARRADSQRGLGQHRAASAQMRPRPVRPGCLTPPSCAVYLAVRAFGDGDLLLAPSPVRGSAAPARPRRPRAARFSALSSSVRLTTDCQSISANSRVWSSPASTWPRWIAASRRLLVLSSARR